MNILWDWNGTLLNDIKISVSAINKTLIEYELDPITVEVYKRFYRFPIRDYYQDIGFDLNIHDKVRISEKFFYYYNRLFQEKNNCLFEEKHGDILKELKISGHKNYLLSAREHSNLCQEVKYLGLESYFIETYGASSALSKSKGQILMELFQNKELSRKETILIGDTISDYELAEKAGINCFLYTGGHQSRGRLNNLKNAVLMDSLELIKRFL